MRRFLITGGLAVILTTPVFAGIYKTYDKNGNVIFTDTPTQASQPVEEKPLMTMPGLSPKAILDSKKGASKVESGPDSPPTAYKISIIKPGMAEVIPSGSGVFKTEVTLEPILWKEHKLETLLDGTLIAKDNLHIEMDPQTLDRGEHRLEIRVLDKNNKVISSGIVEFVVQQPSLLKRNDFSRPK